MDAIDITSSEFSLSNIPDINEVPSPSILFGGMSNVTDYTMYIYIAIAIAILVGVIGILVYKFYINKKKHVTFQESYSPEDGGESCYNGVCPR